VRGGRGGTRTGTDEGYPDQFSMNDKIVALLKLQEFDTSLDGLLQHQARLGTERDELKKKIQTLQQQFEESKKAYTQAQVDKKNLELDIESKQQAIRKSSGELNSVKSNEAYKGLLTQIEEGRKAVSALEDRVLELMETVDRLQKESKDREKSFGQDKGLIEKKIADIDAEEKRLQAEAEEKTKEREAFSQALPEPLRRQYDGVRRGRRGTAVVVPIKENICGGCRMTLPASVINEVMKGAALISCESCSRILFIPPKPAAEPSPENKEVAS
jgi:uncharacterized protein